MTTSKDHHDKKASVSVEVTAPEVDEAAPGVQTTKVKADALVDKVKDLLHEGNVRRILVKNDQGHTVMEIPVTAGVIAAVALPVVTAVGAIAALANDWTIEVHRKESA